MWSARVAAYVAGLMSGGEESVGCLRASVSLECVRARAKVGVHAIQGLLTQTSSSYRRLHQSTGSPASCFSCYTYIYPALRGLKRELSGGRFGRGQHHVGGLSGP